MDEYRDILKNYLDKDRKLRSDSLDDFAGIWELYSAKRKEFLTTPGHTEKYLYFVLEGAQRIYYASEDDREATLIFTYPHAFGGVLDAFLLEKPSAYYYETLSPSKFLRTSHAAFTEVLSQHPALDALIRQQIHYAFAGLLERMVELQCFTSEEKFRALLSRSPQILQVIPHKYLANYLGIDPTNFSKFLNRVQL